MSETSICRHCGVKIIREDHGGKVWWDHLDTTADGRTSYGYNHCRLVVAEPVVTELEPAPYRGDIHD